MTKNFCECERWDFYTRNYSDTFYCCPDLKKWYVGWVLLQDQGGITQVSRYAIPIKYCPLCGGELKKPD